MENFVFRSSFPILNPLCSGMLVYKLEQQTDNDSELDSDLQRLGARDTGDLGALIFFHFISFYLISDVEGGVSPSYPSLSYNDQKQP